MKILALSNVEGTVDELVDLLSDTDASVVGKELAGDTEEFCAVAIDALHRNYDLVIGVADNYVAAEMALNKSRDVRAVRCGSRSDVAMAFRSDPNVILVSGGTGVVKEVAAELEDAGSGVKKPVAQQKKIKLRETAQAAKPAAKEAPAKPALGGLFNRKAKVEEAPEEEEEDTETGPARPGMFGKLKDALGIIDEEKKGK